MYAIRSYYAQRLGQRHLGDIARNGEQPNVAGVGVEAGEDDGVGAQAATPDTGVD